MNHDGENVQRLAATLRENLAKCADHPDVDPVHDTRTGTRRLQATIEDLLRQSPAGEAGEPLRIAAADTLKTLKKIRRAAGPVRDLDVHRKLLEKLVRRAVQPCGDEENEKQITPAQPAIDAPDALETAEAGLRVIGLQQQADDLDTWLKHRRSQQADGLKAQAGDLLARLDKRLLHLQSLLRDKPVRRARKQSPGVVALDAFARLASEMQMLDTSNLHDFRKGAKKARYVAELAAQGDAQARQIGQTLKKLQDEIGDWHDWLVLAEEARAALSDQAAELIALIEARRDRHFVVAMKTAAKLRGRLMGEWLAVSRRPVTRASGLRKRPSATVHRAAS